MENSTKSDKQKIGLLTAVSFIVANMVGTGVFTSLGFQLVDVTDVAALMLLWFIGGVIAFCGAQVYGELGAVMPRSGGEYHFLTKLYHPAIGFASGFFSMFAGFAAPVALAAMALGKYMNVLLPAVDSTLIAAAVILLITAVHCISVRFGGLFQNAFTIVKCMLIVAFIVAGFVLVDTSVNASALPTAETFGQVKSSGFAVCLIYVFYAYSGWNAAAYFVSDMKDPQRNLPKSLLIGTIIVTVLYLLVNYVFLRVAPTQEMAGQIEVGAIAAKYIFGLKGGMIMSGLIALLLVSSISSMVFAGPRVIQVIGEDYPKLGFMSRKNAKGVPVVAILVQTAISLLLLFTSTFDALLTYLGLCMNIFCFLAVLGVFIHRRRHPDAVRPYKVWGYPVTPVLFMLFFIWNFWFLATEKTSETLIGFGTLAIAFIVYLAVRQKNNTNLDKQ